MSHILKISILAGLLTGLSCQTTYSNPCSFLNQLSSRNGVIAAVGIGAGLFLGYKAIRWAYQKSQHYVENKIIDETVDALVLALTTNATLQRLPQEERERAFRKKAKLINMRKRMLNRLINHVADTTNGLSEAHRTLLQEDIELVKAIFTVVDLVRTQNPYEKEYAEASILDTAIENTVMNSIILMSKPENECTPKELSQKQQKAVRRDKIIAKLKGRIRSIWLQKIARSVVLLNLL